MFGNIGNKIKGLAVFITVIGIMSSVVMGILCMVESVGLGFVERVCLGFFIIIIGSLASWIGSLTLYGFGELVDCACIIADKLGNTSNPRNGGIQYTGYSNSGAGATPAAQDVDWICYACGASNKGRIQTCQGCGVTKAWSDSQSRR